MRIHILRHVPYIYYGNIESWIRNWGAELIETRLYQGASLSKEIDSDLLIIMGGPMGVHDEQQFPWLIEEKKLIKRAISQGKKLLGICLGAQLIAQVMGAKVSKARHKEIGWFEVNKTEDAQKNVFLKLLPQNFKTFQWHNDAFEVPQGAQRIFSNKNNLNQGFLYKEQIIGVQFHPEMDEKSIESFLWRSSNELATHESTVQSAAQIKQGYHYSEANKEIMHALIETLIK